MTIKEVLIWAADKKISQLDAIVLLMQVIKKDKVFICSHSEYKLKKFEISRFKKNIARRIKGEPVAYIIEHKEFYGLDFYVNKNVLIPRPETEIIIDSVLSKLKTQLTINKTKKIILLDIGTGSGNIIISILKNLSSLSPITFIATDVSDKALKVAKKNVKLHKVDNKIKFVKSDLLEQILKLIKNKKLEIRNYNLVILANLPYLTPQQYKQNTELKFEPKNALVADKDGLKYYKKLLKQIKLLVTLLRQGYGGQTRYGLQVTLLFEIDPSQKNKIKKEIIKLFPQVKIEFIKDYAHKIRVVRVIT